MCRNRVYRTRKINRVPRGAPSPWTPARLCLALLTLWVATSRVLAGPPFLTDDPEPVDYGHWEFYLASQHARSADGWSGSPALFEMNYGAVPNMQLHLIAPLAYHSPRAGHTHVGYGDTELGVKYRWLQETSTRPQAGVFPLLVLPTGDADRALGNGHVGAFLPLWLQKSWGAENREWTLYGGGGYHVNPGADRRDWTFVGAVLQRQVTDRTTLGGEVFHTTPEDVGGESDTAFSLAAMMAVTELHHLLVSVGRSLDGPTHFQGYVAYQLTL